MDEHTGIVGIAVAIALVAGAGCSGESSSGSVDDGSVDDGSDSNNGSDATVNIQCEPACNVGSVCISQVCTPLGTAPMCIVLALGQQDLDAVLPSVAGALRFIDVDSDGKDEVVGIGSNQQAHTLNAGLQLVSSTPAGLPGVGYISAVGTVDGSVEALFVMKDDDVGEYTYGGDLTLEAGRKTTSWTTEPAGIAISTVGRQAPTSLLVWSAAGGAAVGTLSGGFGPDVLGGSMVDSAVFLPASVFGEDQDGFLVLHHVDSSGTGTRLTRVGVDGTTRQLWTTEGVGPGGIVNAAANGVVVALNEGQIDGLPPGFYSWSSFHAVDPFTGGLAPLYFQVSSVDELLSGDLDGDGLPDILFNHQATLHWVEGLGGANPDRFCRRQAGLIEVPDSIDLGDWDADEAVEILLKVPANPSKVIVNPQIP